MTTITKTVNNAVKALGDGRIGGYLVRWGSPIDKDLQSEFFTANTYLALDWPIPVRPALYQHGFDATLKTAMVGGIDTLTKDDIGVWAEAQMDMSNEYWQYIAQLIADGRLGWSSGALPQGVEVDQYGEIRSWPIIEGSLTPTPAEPRNMITMKHYSDAAGLTAAYKSLGVPVPDALKTEAATESDPVEEAEGETVANQVIDLLIDALEGVGSQERSTATPTPEWSDPVATHNDDETAGDDPPPVEVTMTDNMQATIAQAVEAALAEREAAARQKEIEAKAARADELAARVAELEAREPEQRQPAKRLPGAEAAPEAPEAAAPRIEVGSKYDSVKALDLAFGALMARGRKDHAGLSTEYANALAHHMKKEGRVARKANGNYYKDDELVYSTQASYGDEWVPDLWSSDVWMKARQDNSILPLFNAVDMPSDPYELPYEGTDPTVSFVPETTNEAQLLISGSGAVIPDSKIGTGKAQLDAKKLALRVGVSSEFVEDSIVPVLPMFREQAMRAMADAIDNVLLNGDTTNAGTGNINLDDADPADTSKYLAFDGLRHLPLVTTTANAVDASGAPSLALLRQTRFAMAGKFSINPAGLAWIVDNQTYQALLNLDEVVTVDKFGPNATVLNGQLASIDGTPIIVSAEMGLTEADGKISNTGSNNTKGQAVCVYRRGWVVGYRRRIATDVSYLPYYDAYQMTATMRLAFVYYDADVASVLYDITV